MGRKTQGLPTASICPDSDSPAAVTGDVRFPNASAVSSGADTGASPTASVSPATADAPSPVAVAELVPGWSELSTDGARIRELDGSELSVKWMWADAGALGHHLAYKDPARWSRAKSIKDTISEFRNCNPSNKSRPVHLYITRAGAKEIIFVHGPKDKAECVDDAIAILESFACIKTQLPVHETVSTSTRKPVLLGKMPLTQYCGFATHWALQVHGTWYEVPGAGASDSSSPNKVIRTTDECSVVGASPIGGLMVGTTSKSQKAIDGWLMQWLKDNPTYVFTSTNCQKFCKDFADFLCDGKATLPLMEAGLRNAGQGPRAWAAAGLGTLAAQSSVGRAEYQRGIARAMAEGPHADAKMMCGKGGVGFLTRASAGRAEVGLGNVGVHADLNVNTGVIVHNGTFEGVLLGFGVKVGINGVQINTPLGGIGAASQ